MGAGHELVRPAVRVDVAHRDPGRAVVHVLIAGLQVEVLVPGATGRLEARQGQEQAHRLAHQALHQIDERSVQAHVSHGRDGHVAATPDREIFVREGDAVGKVWIGQLGGDETLLDHVAVLPEEQLVGVEGRLVEVFAIEEAASRLRDLQGEVVEAGLPRPGGSSGGDGLFDLGELGESIHLQLERLGPAKDLRLVDGHGPGLVERMGLRGRFGRRRARLRLVRHPGRTRHRRGRRGRCDGHGLARRGSPLSCLSTEAHGSKPPDQTLVRPNRLAVASTAWAGPRDVAEGGGY